MKEEERANVWDLLRLESYFEKNPDEYFFDFLKLGSFEAGLIRLVPGEKDTQTAHDADELYYVISGSGMLRLGDGEVPVSKGKIVFVPKGMAHAFFGNREVLLVFYVFPRQQ